MSNTKKRIIWLDVLKGIGILLVIFQHCLPSGQLSNFILSFHMPLFFFASGVLFSNHASPEYFAYSKLNSLVLPLFCVSLINLLIQFSISSIGFPNFACAILLKGSWFVEILFFVSCIYFFINKQLRDKKTWIVLSVGIFALFELIIIPIVLQEICITRHQIAAGILFYMMGHICNNALKLKYSGNKILLAIISIIILGTLYLTSQHNTPVFMYAGEFGRITLFLINACLGIIAMLGLSKVIINCNFLEYFGKNSLIVLFTHSPIIAILSHFTYIYMKIEFSTWTALVIFLIVTTCELIIIPLTNKYCLWVTGRYKLM